MVPMKKGLSKPACLQNVQAAALEDLWVPHELGRSIRHFILPRPLIIAYRLWHEKKGEYATLEIHSLKLRSFSCSYLEAEQLQRQFAVAAVFQRCAAKDAPYVFQWADVVPQDIDESSCLSILELWMYLGYVPSFWKRKHFAEIRSKLK